MSTTAPQNTKPRTRREVEARICHAHSKVRDFLKKSGNERLRSLWPDWHTRFQEILDNAKQEPEVAISLVGGTGAGKSTLLNALIGARVLPVSVIRACTSAVCEVSYGEGPYQVHVEFVPRAAWEKEVEQLRGDLRDSSRPVDGEDGASRVLENLTRTARNKLWTIYRPSEDANRADFNLHQLTEPPEIREALDAGYIDVTCQDAKDLRKVVTRYLDSKHRFWPIVKSVSVKGPFEPLRDGAKIVDLPGLNDPNEAREEVTKKHLKTCRFVWIVFNMKRALTRDLIEFMQGDNFLRQIVMDGRTNALTFVGTAADEVHLESGIEEFGLDEDAGMAEVVAARNAAVRREVHGQLMDLAYLFGQSAGEQRPAIEQLAARLTASKIFTVSAQEYLRLSNFANTRPAGFESLEQTEVPALIEHMQAICASYGISAHLASVRDQLDTLIAEIKREIHSQQGALRTRQEVSERSQQEVRAAVQAAQHFLDDELADAREHLVQALEAGQEVLAERVNRAVDRAKHDLDQTLNRWRRMHPQTIGAVCRRGGVYAGSTGRNDFPAELSKPILDGIAFAWSDFFGDRLAKTLEKAADRLLRRADGYRDRLRQALKSAPDISPELFASLDGVLETTARILQEIQAQTKNKMERKIQHTQRGLYESVPQEVRANMQPAFEQAAQQEGTGMRDRMVNILSNHAHQVAQTMFDDARESLLNGVRSLNDWLAREYDQMIDAVKRDARLAAENFITMGAQHDAQSNRRRASYACRVLRSGRAIGLTTSPTPTRKRGEANRDTATEQRRRPRSRVELVSPSGETATPRRCWPTQQRWGMGNGGVRRRSL